MSTLKFGFGAVKSGQKASAGSNEPILTANSSPGKFTLSEATTRYMGIRAGEYVQFCTNWGDIERMANEGVQELVDVVDAYNAKNGTDYTVNSPYGIDILIKEFGSIGIARGMQVYDAKGNKLQRAARLTKEERAEMLEIPEIKLETANRVHKSLIARAIEKGALAEDETAPAEALLDFVVLEDVLQLEDDVNGSKTMTLKKGMTGTGMQLSMTDNNIWKKLKSDLSDPKSINRIYKVDIENPIVASINNGFEEVETTIYTIVFDRDEKPMVRDSKKNAATQTEVEGEVEIEVEGEVEIEDETSFE